MEKIKDIGVIASAILSLIAVGAFIIKPIRKKLLNWIKDTSHVEKTDNLIVELKESFDKFSLDIKNDISELKDDSELNRAANKCVCSNRILNAYDKYKDEEFLDASEKDSLIEFYSLCTKLGTNGKIKFRYDELMQKPVKSG